jgi:hypothetical protein
MKKTLLFLAAIFLTIPLAASAFAVDVKPKLKAKPMKAMQSQIDVLESQITQLLSALKERPAANPGRDGRDGLSVSGAQGAKGDKGDKGETGSVGATGPSGVAGVDGAAGADGVAGVAGVAGVDGRHGSGFPSGAIVLMNGNCPDGFTIQGAQNRWTVYANDTTGRPWLTSGSSAQLFMSACQVN